MRTTVDVLTLSATPIPRTLHMSLLGIRDISNLETPPPDRKAIETRVTRFDREVVKRAILRELNRDGQIYFVHNRVYDITTVADLIQSIVPEARIGIAHGQMHGEELERTMLAFIKRQVRHPGRDHDHRERPGYPQRQHDLHQRGRQVRPGRSASASRPGRPLQAPGVRVSAARVGQVGHAQRGQAAEGDRGVHRSSGPASRSRLRDLEIRGAGNILGAEQSGHIESVGYELYCSLLESAARSLTNQPEKPLFDCSVELGWRAYLPRDYVPAPRIKLELYRRLGRLRTLNHLADFRQEMIDRFGPLPRPAENLLIETEIRIMAGAWKLERIHVEQGEYVVLTYGDRPRIEALARRHPGLVRVVDAKKAYVPLGEDPVKTPEIAERVRALLRT